MINYFKGGLGGILSNLSNSTYFITRKQANLTIKKPSRS